MSRSRALRLACGLAAAAFAVVLTGALAGAAAPAVAAPRVAAPTVAAPAVAAPAVAVRTGTVPASPRADASPAPAPPAALAPLVDCVQDAPLGAVSSRTVVLGYRSTAAAPLTVPAGSAGNTFTAGAPDRGQPSDFAPGEHHGVWLLTVDATAEPGLGWSLGAATVRFDAAPACTAATTLAVSATDRVTAGGVVTVTATVARMLLAAPGTGTVAFALDGGAPVAIAVDASGVARADLPVATAGAHLVTAVYRPIDGSGLLPSSGSVALTAAAASAPLSVVADSVVAGSTSVLVTVSRPVGAGAATVDVMTADGTAHAGADYAAVSTTLALADGQAAATVRVPLPARAAGAPAATFFVLLQRASAAVTTASATVSLPAVPAVAVGAAGAATAPRGDPGAGAVSSALPPDDPTAGATATSANAAQELVLILGGLLLSAGGVLGVIGLVRAVGIRGAQV